MVESVTLRVLDEDDPEVVKERLTAVRTLIETTHRRHATIRARQSKLGGMVKEWWDAIPNK